MRVLNTWDCGQRLLIEEAQMYGDDGCPVHPTARIIDQVGVPDSVLDIAKRHVNDHKEESNGPRNS